jgi:hypothetical protein
VGEGDLGTLPLFYPSKIAQVLEKGTTGTFLVLNYFDLFSLHVEGGGGGREKNENTERFVILALKFNFPTNSRESWVQLNTYARHFPINSPRMSWTAPTRKASP